MATVAFEHPSPMTPRILIVEDEHLVALDIQQSVERMGYRAIVVYSGEAALDAVSEGAFALVLMDIKLKGAIDGIDAARSIHSSTDLPVIYLTAYADDRTVDRARSTEPYGYICKPFQERELKAAIEVALQRAASDRMHREQQQWQRFLADASGLMAGTLDYRTVTSGLAELVVPQYADWCTIQLIDHTDMHPALGYTRPNGKHKDQTDALGSGLVGVLRTGRSQLWSEFRDLGALTVAVGDQHADVLREIGGHSLVCVPIVAREQVLGVLALVAGRARPAFSTSDLLFIEDLGHRLGMSLDNALLYRMAERAIRMRDDVLAIVSHDLRTPLQTILMQAETLKMQPPLHGVGAAISRSAQVMNRLIGDLLDASAINAGQLALDIRIHSARELAAEAVEMFRSQAEARQLAVHEELPAGEVLVRCDRDRIIQVLSNLIGNAIKFTPRGGSVVVTLTVDDAGVHFEVRDTGRGIAEDQLPMLFDRFWRGQRRRNGAGLGLFIARGIIAAHGSTIGVESAVGRGSRFFFSLPEARP